MSEEFLNKLLSENPIASNQKEEDKLLASLLDEIDLISEEAIKQFVRSVLLKAPDFFWLIPASFSGDFHPPDERAAGGNILHTKRVCRIVHFICKAYERSALETDILLASAVIHDVTKGIEIEGQVRYDPMHPYTVDSLVNEVRQADTLGTGEGQSSSIYLEEEIINQILRQVRCHLGGWSPIPETIPITTLDWILHLSDYLAANLHTIIDGDQIKELRWQLPK